MIKNLPRLIHPSIWLIAFLIAAGNLPAWSQCTNSSQFGTVNAPTNNVPLTITTCAFGGEYSTINSCTAGSSYQFSATGGTGNYLTVRQGSPGGTVLGFGFSPITVTCTVSGPLYLHYNTDAGCGTDGTCHTGVVTCTSCSGGSDPCVGITTLSCGTAVTAAPSGTGIWSNLTCGFSTPGQEKIYSFTAPTTGAYSLQVNSVSGGYIDYMYKAASGGCSSTGWTCIDDINFTGTYPIGTLTAGTTYYILLDPEGTGSYSHNFQIVCPSTFDPCASISTLTCGSAVTATPSGAGVWSNATCGFSTPGQEKIYSFTPTLTGTHSLQVNSVSGGYIDYMYKVASGGCNSTGWTCIDDINFTGTFPIGTLTAGTTYYILLDPEGTGSYSHNFQIVCPTFDPCTSITTLSCDAAVSTTQSGSGLWSPGSCGFSTPGQEKIYSFTPITTGAHSLQVNSTSNTTYIDYFYKPASGGCNSTGWTCIDDVFSAGTYTIGTLTAGTTYYILLDPESTISVTQNFQIVCPPPLGPPPCVPAPTSPTNGQSQICPSATQSLSWPASGGATSYDVYFGTTNPPPFVANTASTSYNASTPTNTTYYWEIRPVGPGGTAAGCTVWNFNKSDVTPPSITCPGNISVPNTTNACSAIVTYTVSGGDNCSAPSLTLISGLPGGSVPFPVGVTVNTWRATDASNNSATCSFTVTVNDTQLPNITCPANIVTSNAPNLCSAVVTYSILGSDNCTAPTLTLIGGLSSGSSFPVGVTTNTWRATDQANNTRTCSFTVTVNDTQKPVITCPANIVRNNDPGKCYAVVTYPNATATDNCSATVTLLSGLASGSQFPVGTSTIEFQAKDPSDNTSTCSFTIRVNDVEPPVVTCPPALNLPNDPGQCSRQINWVGQATYTDNCGASYNQSNSPGFFPVGEHTVVHTVIDYSGNSATCVQNVTVYDQEYPGIYCPQNMVVKTDEFDCVATVSYSASGYDNCPGYSITYSTDSPAAFEAGYNNVTATITDGAGNSTSCTFQIRVDNRQEICNDFDDDCDGLVDESEGWEKVAKVLAVDGSSQAQYGLSVDIHKGYAIVGSNKKTPGGQPLGAAYILIRTPNGWTQMAKLLPADVEPDDLFGASVAIHGNIAAVGAPSDDDPVGNEGAVYVFYRTPANVWNLIKKVKASDADPADNFGISVDLDGERLLVGANHDDEKGANAGAAYVFYQNQGGNDNWGQVAKLVGNTSTDGDNMGVSVSIDGDHALVGATGVDNLIQNTGGAFVFGRNVGGADAWGEVTKILAPSASQNDNFGGSVGISGNYAIIGADQNDQKGLDAGAAYIFFRNENNQADSWGLSRILRDYNGSAGKRFGSGVGIDGDYAVVGSQGDSPFGAGSGRGFLYLRLEDNWIQVDELTDGAGQAADNLGTTAAISGTIVILGAPLDDIGADVNEGSVVIFEGLCVENNERPTERNADEILADASLRCFPVPFQDVLHVEINDIVAANVQVTVINALGQEVANLFQGAIDGQMRFQWRPSANMAQGYYFLRLRADGKIITKPLVLTR